MEMIGTIHHRMYNKILLQEKLNRSLLELSQNKGKLEGLVDSEVEILPEGELEKIADLENIHGWIQTKIIYSERRMALIIKGLLQENVSLETMDKTAYKFGRERTIEADNFRDLWKGLDAVMMNGMPCDKIVEASMDDENLYINFMKDIHKDNFIMYDVDPQMYNEIRYNLVRGLIDNGRYTLEENSNGFIVKIV